MLNTKARGISQRKPRQMTMRAISWCGFGKRSTGHETVIVLARGGILAVSAPRRSHPASSPRCCRSTASTTAASTLSARRGLDHVRRALALVEQRRAAPGAEASGRLRRRVLEARNASPALRQAGVLAPTADIGRIRRAVRATACRGVIVPGPKSGKVDL